MVIYGPIYIQIVIKFLLLMIPNIRYIDDILDILKPYTKKRNSQY